MAAKEFTMQDHQAFCREFSDVNATFGTEIAVDRVGTAWSDRGYSEDAIQDEIEAATQALREEYAG